MRSPALALFATAFLAGPALADQMPNMVPSHDVTGTYVMTGQNAPQTISVEYSKSADVLRLNMSQGQGYILYDFAAKDAKMVMPQMQRYMDQPRMADRVAAAQSGGGQGDDVSITRQGTESIAGYQCTDYKAADNTKGTWSVMCVTQDGVLLKMQSSDGTQAVAQSMSYEAVPEADVQVPAGYTEFVMPQLPAGMSMPGGMSGMAPGSMGAMPSIPGMSSTPSVPGQ